MLAYHLRWSENFNPREMSNIHQASSEELQFCFDLEVSLSPDNEQASENGFFLPGASFKVYEDLAETGFIRVISENGKPIGFVMVVPPGHAIMSRLLINNESLIWFDKESTFPSVDNCYWIAKVAVLKDFKRQGYGKILYENAMNHFEGLTALTATALSPIRNQASENFHRAMNLNACGVFLSGNRGNLSNIVNILWKS